MLKRSQVGFGGPSFALEHPGQTKREAFLADMERSVPWSKLRALVEPVYADPRTRRSRPLELDRMLRVYFLQRWYRLGDSAVHEAICDSSAMRWFICIGTADSRATPDESAIRSFRQLLQEYGLGEVIVQATDRHLRSLGLAVAPGALIDPTVIGNQTHTQAPFARVIDTAGATAS
jgi:IS5 family transposase